MRKTFIKILCIIAMASFAAVLHITSTLKPAALIPWGSFNCRFSNDDTFLKVKNALKKYGFDLQCASRHPLDKAEFIFVMAKNYHLKKNINKPAYLWLVESPLTISIPAIKRDEEAYNKIFTYSKKLVDNKKYFYLPIDYPYQKNVLNPFPTPKNKKVLLAQIASNNYRKSKREKYSQRRIDALYLIKNHPEDFLLYGSNWAKLKESLTPDEQVNFGKSYKGRIPKKSNAVQQAKFVLAYENAQYDGYISEKIFDVMAAGSVPVYLGAPNITDYVPKECFINREDFKSEEELYLFLKNMPEQTYQKYYDCVNQFIHQPHHYNDFDAFFSLIIKEIYPDTPKNILMKMLFTFRAYLNEQLLLFEKNSLAWRQDPSPFIWVPRILRIISLKNALSI